MQQSSKQNWTLIDSWMCIDPVTMTAMDVDGGVWEKEKKKKESERWY